MEDFIKQGATVTVHQDLCIEDLHEALIPKGKDSDALVGADLTEYRSVLGKLNWLQSRTQFHISYHFSRCASAAASATIMDAKELNKVVRMVKDKPQRLLYAPIKGIPRLMGFPDAALLAAWSVHLHLSAKEQGERYKRVFNRLRVPQDQEDSSLHHRG